MGIKELDEMIFGRGQNINSRSFAPRDPATDHPGSKKPKNSNLKKKNRAAAKRARMSRKVNRHG